MIHRSSGWSATCWTPTSGRRALAGVRGVIHTAGWVSLGPDRQGVSHAINVESTRHLLAEAARAGVERFVYTSTLYTLAAGTKDQPADEFTPWNLQRVDSSYTKTKRQAERLVLEASRSRFTTIALCPGMVLGPRDPKPTSTKIVRAYSRTLVAIVPRGGIPIVDAGLLALAHRRALIAGDPGARYAVVGPYLSYRELAALVASITGRPRWIVPLPDRLEPLVVLAADWFGPLARWWWPDVSRQLAAGGFLRLHVRGDRAERALGWNIRRRSNRSPRVCRGSLDKLIHWGGRGDSRPEPKRDDETVSHHDLGDGPCHRGVCDGVCRVA